MKNYIILLVSFLFSGQLFSQDALEMKPSFAPTVEENSLLWRISGKELATTSYLYGTIHMIDKDDFFLTDSTRAAIDRAKLVTFEINMEDMTDLASQMGLLTKAFMGGNKTLKDLLTPEEYTLVQDHFKEMGMPLFFFERMKPMFLTVMTSGDMAGGLSSGEMVSYEMEIMDIAKQNKATMGGLETVEFQMSVFDSIPYEAQAKMLVESIKSTKGENDEFAKMVEMYKQQDIAGMVSMMGEDEGIGQYEDLLLVGRNKNWIPIMGDMMVKQPVFFAVGAGHLGGENGVVALLRKEGYKVEAVR